MAIKLCNDGTLECNTVKYNYKQARNLVANGDFESGDSGWTFSSSRRNGTLGYKSTLCVEFDPNVLSMSTQPMPAPIAGHKYYGGMMWRTAGSSFSLADGRLEWYQSDSANGRLIFAQPHEHVATSNSWIKLSSIVSLPSVNSGTWIIRNFTVNGTTKSYADRLIIIDLTESFGAGNEPTKEWCDENILQWEQFSNAGNIMATITDQNLNIMFTWAQHSELYIFNYNVLNSSWEPRDFMYLIGTSANYREALLYSAFNVTIDKNKMYYAAHDSRSYNNYTFDCYFPFAEPMLGQTEFRRNYNGGGGMENWKRISFYNHRLLFTSGSHPQRWDINNNYTVIDWRTTNMFIVEVDSFLSTYNSALNKNIVVTSINREFMDRIYMGKNPSIIQIKDHQNTSIKLNTNYDIVCNDIEIDPTVNKIVFKPNGTILCKKLVKSQTY